MTHSLDALLQAHLSQLDGLWQRVAPAHAGLDCLSALSWEVYRDKLPPSGEFSGLRNFHAASVVIPASVDWIAANAARDLLSLLLIYIEAVRRFYETTEVEHSELSPQEREIILRERLQRPTLPQDSVNRLNSVLHGGFPAMQELLTIEYVTKLFMARVARQELTEPVTLTLCTQTDGSREDHIGSSHSDIGRLILTVSSVTELEPSAELLYRIYLTACVIMNELAQTVRISLGNGQTMPEYISQ